MDYTQIIIILLVIFLFVAISFAAYLLTKPSKPKFNPEISGLVRAGKVPQFSQKQDADEIKLRTGRASVKPKKTDDLETKLLKAGYYTQADREQFERNRTIIPLVLAPTMGLLVFWGTQNAAYTVLAVLFGLTVGYFWPVIRLDGVIENREDDLMFYLPLVIEQVSIGVSSGLDIGPCISNVIALADERNSHNPVTELFVQVEKLIQAGMSLDNALTEVADTYGKQELRHAFMFLSQCAAHGGEVSKQLQDLADSVAMQRQISIEAKITKLPVKATFPLFMVFGGFFLMLLITMGLQLLGSMGGAGI